MYPGNEILLTISRLAQRIGQLHVTTPLGKLLISLQVLSRKAQDWEQHAARHVSLAGEMAGIASLIKEWREIELGSWGDLLRCKEVEYVDLAIQQWYALSRVLRSVPEELISGVSAESLGCEGEGELEDNEDLLELKKLTNARRSALDPKRRSKRVNPLGLSVWHSLQAATPAWLISDDFDAKNTRASDKAKREAAEAIAAEIERKNREAIGESSMQTDVETSWGAAAMRMLNQGVLEPESQVGSKGRGENNTGNHSKKFMTSSSYLSSIFDILDGFLRKSSVGEFPARLHVIRIFALQLEQEWIRLNNVNREDNTDEKGTPMRLLASIQMKKAHLAFGVWHYYSQFLPAIRSLQAASKQPILQRIRGEVKLGKWETMNTYALIEHSDKVHRKLNKLIREYQGSVLEKRFHVVLRRELMGDLATENGDLQPTTTVPSDRSFFPRLLNEPQPTIDSLPGRLVLTAGLPSQIPVGIISAVAAGAHTHVPRLRTLQAKVVSYLNSLCSLEDAVKPLGKADDVRQAGKVKGKSRINGDGGKRTTINPSQEMQSRKKKGNAKRTRTKKKCPVSVARCAFAYKRTGAERLCGAIFERITNLRGQPNGDGEMEEVPRPVKHRAMVDLLKELKSQGIAQHRNHLPRELKDAVHMLAVPSPLPCETAGDLNTGCTQQNIHDKAESYYQRNVAELMQLRTQVSTTHSQDVSPREVGLIHGLSENLYYQCVMQRVAVGAAFCDHRNLQNAIVGLHASLRQQEEGSEGVSVDVYLLQQELSLLIDRLMTILRICSTAQEANDLACSREDPVWRPLETFDASSTTLEVRRALEALQASMQTLVSLPIATPTSGKKLPMLALSPALDNFGIPCRGKSRTGPELKVHRSHPVVATTVSCVEAVIAKLDTKQPTLRRMVSSNVWNETRQALLRYCDLAVIHPSRGSAHAGMDIDSIGTGHALIDDHTVSLVSTCVDLCLTATQRLRSLSKHGDDALHGSRDIEPVRVQQLLLGGHLHKDTASNDSNGIEDDLDVLFNSQEKRESNEREENSTNEVESETSRLLPLVHSLALSSAATASLQLGRPVQRHLKPGVSLVTYEVT